MEAHLLRVVCPVEVVPRDAALGAGHVTSDDEVRATEVLTDHHVLHRLSKKKQNMKPGTICMSRSRQQLRHL